MKILSRVLTFAVLALAFGLAVYRAKVQPIAHDEALEYEWFLGGGVERVLAYNPTNHVLFTLLAKPIVWALGVSEFALRVPSLFGAAAYLIATYFLCRRVFGEGIMLFLSVAMLCLNPQILDFMAAARGYILGLACLAAGMYFIARVAEQGEFDPHSKEWRWGCPLASIFLALSVVASFTNIVSSGYLMWAFSGIALGGFYAILDLRDPRVRTFAGYFIVPGVSLGFCLLWPYLIQARLAQVSVYSEKASDAVRDAFTASFLYKWTDDVLSSLGAVPAPAGSWQGRVTDLGEYFLFPLLCCSVVVGLILAWRSPAESRTNQNVQCRIFGSTAVASLFLIVLIHVAVKVDYPISRFCLFLIPLFTVSAVLAGREIFFRFPYRALKAVGLLVAAIVVFDYVLSLQTSIFRYNAYDVISRDLYQTIAQDAQNRGLREVRVGGTWWYEPEINFYRRKYHAKWMMEYDIKDRSYWWQTPNSLLPSDYDYFVYTPGGDPALSGPRIKTIYQDAIRSIKVIRIEK